MKRQRLLLLPLLLAVMAGCNRADVPGGPGATNGAPAAGQPMPAPQPAPAPAPQAEAQAAAPTGAPSAAAVNPHAGQPMPAAPAAAPAAAVGTSGKLVLPGAEAQVPTSWSSQPPASSMRAAQFLVPGRTPDANAEVAIFHFEPGQGGSQEANIARWVSQFSTPNGQPVQPAVKKFQVNGMEVTTVELQGNYARGVGMGPQGQGKAEQVLLVGLVETPKGRITVQLYGPKATVNQHRAGFNQMLQSMKPA